MIVKIGWKEGMEAIPLISQWYNSRFELVKIEPDVNQIKDILTKWREQRKKLRAEKTHYNLILKERS